MNPFDYVNSINNGKNLLDEGDDKEVVVKDYNPFMTNRAFPYHNDTLWVGEGGGGGWHMP